MRARRERALCVARDARGGAVAHCARRRSAPASSQCLRRSRAELASQAETDALVSAVPMRSACRLAAAVSNFAWRRPVLARTRQRGRAELQAYERRVCTCANAANDRLRWASSMAPRASSTSRATPTAPSRATRKAPSSCARPALTSRTGPTPQALERIRDHAGASWPGSTCFATTHDRKTVLDRAEILARAHCAGGRGDRQLEQTWGEYWRRGGDLKRALEHKHRALNIFERLGDQRSILVTHLNLSLLYGESKDFERAIRYTQQVLELAARQVVEPAIVVSSHGNLGADLPAGQGRSTRRSRSTELALAQALQANLRLHANRSPLQPRGGLLQALSSSRSTQMTSGSATCMPRPCCMHRSPSPAPDWWS